MNLEQSHALLTFIASVDNRRFDDATVIAWQKILSDVDHEDATTAAVSHFATSTDYLMPAHVRSGALELMRDRRRHEREQREIEAGNGRPAGALTDRSAEIQAFVRGVRSILPPSDPDKLHPRRAEWRRRQRLDRAEPNPHYAPTDGAA